MNSMQAYASLQTVHALLGKSLLDASVHKIEITTKVLFLIAAFIVN